MRLPSVLGLTCGLILAASVSAQTTPAPKVAQPPAQPAQPQAGTTNLYPAAVYNMPGVGKSLNLTQTQITNLNKLTDQTQAKFRDDFAKLGTLKDAERITQLQGLNQRYLTDWNKGAADILNDTQRTRYQQLHYQYGGFGSLYDPNVQKQLNLTAEQQKALQAQWDWSNQQLQEINRLGTTDATKGAEAYRNYWTARQERFDKFLTPDQQKTWRTMTGEPYTFLPNFVPPPK